MTCCKGLDGADFDGHNQTITITEGDYVPANTEEGEEPAAGADPSAETVNNLVHAHNLQVTKFDKKSYMTYIKGYMGALKAKLQETNPSRVDAFMKGAAAVVKNILAKFDDFSFYTTESLNPDGIVLLQFWKDGAVDPCFWIWKYACIKSCICEQLELITGLVFAGMAWLRRSSKFSTTSVLFLLMFNEALISLAFDSMHCLCFHSIFVL